MAGRNFFSSEPSQVSIPWDAAIVFISYRHKYDAGRARQCAEILRHTSGIDIWFDEEDGCLTRTLDNGLPCERDHAIAGCIERGLDVASALLGIIGPQTFSSPWIAYEISGARGRQKFVSPFQNRARPDDFPCPSHNPLIAHLIERNVEMLPAFVTLGTPLYDLSEVERWARSVAKLLAMIREGITGSSLLQEAYRPNDCGVRYFNWSYEGYGLTT